MVVPTERSGRSRRSTGHLDSLGRACRSSHSGPAGSFTYQSASRAPAQLRLRYAVVAIRRKAADSSISGKPSDDNRPGGRTTSSPDLATTTRHLGRVSVVSGAAVAAGATPYDRA